MAIDIILYTVVLAAAAFQTITGIGFAMIAGPIILLIVNDSIAIQINIFLNLLIALVLTPFLYRHADRQLLKMLFLGTFAGLPIGIALFLWADVEALKFSTGIVIAFMALTLVLGFFSSSAKISTNWSTDIFAGGITGVMSTFLAMPGPAIATYMGASGLYGKQTTRATILVLFVFAYASALVVHALFVGIDQQAMNMSVKLAPATLVGVGLGSVLAPRVNESVFRSIVILALVLTSLSLLVSPFI